MAFNRVSVVDDIVRVRKVLVSVYDKTGLREFLDGLASSSPGVEFYATGKTFEIAKEAAAASGGRAKAISVSDYTGQCEMQGGLVKTLDFKIYLGILSEPYNQEHEQDRQRVGAVLFDMVCVNLYPFAKVLSASAGDIEELRQNIDIGGPCMLRAAAKAYLRVASLSDPSDYGAILAEIAQRGGLGLESRLRMAAKTFATTAAYDAAIAGWLAGQPDVGAGYRVLGGE